MSDKKEATPNEQKKVPARTSQGQQAPTKRQAEAGGMDKSPESRVDALAVCLAKAGTLKLTKEEQKALTAPFDQSVVEQLPSKSGPLDYIPHTFIARRLNDVLGIGQWSIVRCKEWLDVQTSTVYGSYVMIVRGVWVGDTVAGWPYYANNPRQDYADALESTRGVALRRMAAKSIGCGDQVWVKVPDCPPTGPSPSQPRPDGNGKPTPPRGSVKAASGVEFMQLLDRLKMAATTGSADLQLEWESIGKEARILMGGELSFLKQMAAFSDEQIEASARAFPNG